jgi:hypothetical protein
MVCSEMGIFKVHAEARHLPIIQGIICYFFPIVVQNTQDMLSYIVHSCM